MIEIDPRLLAAVVPLFDRDATMCGCGTLITRGKKLALVTSIEHGGRKDLHVLASGQAIEVGRELPPRDRSIAAFKLGKRRPEIAAIAPEDTAPVFYGPRLFAHWLRAVDAVSVLAELAVKTRGGSMRATAEERSSEYFASTLENVDDRVIGRGGIVVGSGQPSRAVGIEVRTIDRDTDSYGRPLTIRIVPFEALFSYVD